MTWHMKILLLGNTKGHLMVQHREGTVRRHVVTQKTLCFMPCHSCCQPQLQFAVEAVKSSTSLASHFCKNTYSTILASQMHVDLHTSPANTTGFAQDQSYRVKAMISHCLHENTKHLENMHSTPQPFVYNTAPHHVFLPREIKHKNESYSQKKKILTHLRDVPSRKWWMQELSLKVLPFCLAPAQLWWQIGQLEEHECRQQWEIFRKDTHTGTKFPAIKARVCVQHVRLHCGCCQVD